ncbi:MAG TPA: transcription-repair coupling factor [Thermomicrobiales bacterium]|nr:transcription-repair coupling factor [Thermomicrobiales bacterium]
MTVLLTPLLDELGRDAEVAALTRDLERAGPGAARALAGVPAAARPAVLATLARDLDRPLLVVTSRQDVAAHLYANLCSYLAVDDEVVLWPAPDALPYEQMPVEPADAGRRIAILDRLLRVASGEREGAFVLVAAVRGLAAQLMSPAALAAHREELRPGQEFSIGASLTRWLALGYEPVVTVEEPGQFSRRGGLIDVFSPGYEQPVRIELFGDEIDSLRPFDPFTQRSSGRLPALTILPACDLPLWEREAARERLLAADTTGLRPEVAAEWRRLLDMLEGAEVPPVQDILAPYFSAPPAGLADYLGSAALAVVDEPDAVRLAADQLRAQAEELRAGFEAGGELPRGLLRPYHTGEEIARALAGHARLDLGESAGETPLRWERFHEPAQYAGRLDKLAADLAAAGQAGRRTVIVTEQAGRLRDLLLERDLYPLLADGLLPAELPSLAIVHGDLRDGWVYAGDGSESLPPLAVLSDHDVFGTVRLTRRPSRRTAAQHEAFARSLTPGQFVVHLEHGIARYAGMATMAVGEAAPGGGPAPSREFLVLEYAGDDKLYVPIDQTDRVAPYTGPGGDDPQLNRLGSPEWARTKRRVQRAVADMADELLALYATREATPGHAFGPDTTWDRELTESFPYVETEDQLRAIEDVKADMERERPMDRLVAGDVGYGKTEVALRAAFKAVNDGTQVAVLVPTTVLALQHTRTFKERLATFPARVEMLSRLRPAGEREAVKRGLADGSVDIVVGTHALLSSDVRFHNLGLLIVDEEQRFGVAHKERIKKLRATVDVLTMSATPIPRTLHLSLAGIRDLSVIDTPPDERYPIRTFVTPYDDTLVREVLLRELDRGGQVFFVHNRVQTLPMVAARLRELVPEARIVLGHGQMDQGQLEKVMLAFLRREYDVLVCTTIIESGLDIPTVNTIVIDDAPHYGLTQLHQLRGRVGRASTRAYAYLFYHPGRPMTVEAQERLETIQQATELGAGFKIAMKDLELRGAGNILGAEQSGHIAAVGFDLYVQLLAAAVEERKTGVPVEEERPVLLDLPLTALLPDAYIADPATRVREYRRIAAVRTQPDLDDLLRELADRFGSPPDEVRALGYLASIKLRAVALGLEAVTYRDGTLLLRPVPTARLDQAALRRAFGGALTIGPTSLRLATTGLKVSWEDALDTLLGAIEAAKARLADLAAARAAEPDGARRRRRHGERLIAAGRRGTGE